MVDRLNPILILSGARRYLFECSVPVSEYHIADEYLAHALAYVELNKRDREEAEYCASERDLFFRRKK